MSLPTGAAEILRARENGKRPDTPIAVSLCGPLGWANPTVYVNQAKHDWVFAMDLDVIVVVKPAASFVQQTLSGLARFARSVALWDLERGRGMDLWPVWKGVNVPELHEVSLEDRRRAVFVRWARVAWLPGENRRFAS